MDRPSVTLRDAAPLHEEGVVFARYLDDIAPFYRVMLGRRVVHTIAKAFTQPGHDLSYQNTIFAEEPGSDLASCIRSAVPRSQHELPRWRNRSQWNPGLLYSSP